jgi:hypothetical protein
MSLLKSVADFLTNLGPEGTKLSNRIRDEVKSEDDAKLLNELFDKLTNQGKG